VENIVNNETAGAEIFPAIPVSTSLVGEVQIQNDHSQLILDNNDDGNPDQTISAPVVLTAEQLRNRQGGTGTVTLRGPTSSPSPGDFSVPQTVSLLAPDWDLIYYTTNGGTPAFGVGQLYSATIDVGSTVTIKAIGCMAEGACSNIVSFAYAINSPPPLELLLEKSIPQTSQVAILDSLLFLRDPFLVQNAVNFFTPPNDGNTRVTVFVSNLILDQGEAPSAVQINLVDASNQTQDVPAEDVRVILNLPLSQVTFRLPSNLSVGLCTIKVKAHGQMSNIGTFRIRI
jgi:hypothetical protein